MNIDEFTKNVDTEKLSREALALYDTVKDSYEPHYMGKFLTIDPVSKEMYMGDTGVEAILIARKKHPTTVFYLKRIGFEYTQFWANTYMQKPITNG
jgi:hypothetical protein